MEKRLFTSESVTEGHPDRTCEATATPDVEGANLSECFEQ